MSAGMAGQVQKEVLQVPNDSVILMEDPFLQSSAFLTKGWDELTYGLVDSSINVLDHRALNEWGRDLYGQFAMANLATPLASVVYSPSMEIGPRSGFESYFTGWGSAYAIPLYDVKAPLSGIRYLSGYDNGQMFGGYLTLNPHERFNLYLDFQRVSARGNYFSQDNLSDQLKVSSNYRTKNNKYLIQSAFLYNKNKGRESGGITNLSGFSNPDSLVTSRELINIRWYNSYFQASQFHLVLDQQYLPFSDSTGARGVGVFHEGDIRYSKRGFTSRDSILGNWYIDSVQTADSMQVVQSDQRLGIVFKSGVKGFSFAKVGIGYAFGTIENSFVSASSNAVYLSGELKGEAERFDWSAEGKYHIGGSQVGGFDLRGFLQAQLWNLEVGAEAAFQNQMPSLQSQTWYGNDFQWSNNWNSTYYQRVTGFAKYSKWAALRLNLHNWNGAIYYDQSALPKQLVGGLQLVQTELDLFVPFNTWLNLSSRTTLQLTSGSGDVLRLPTLVNRTGLFATWTLFNGALKGYSGVDVYVYSKYKANAYMPVTGVFYLQDNQEIGDFVYVNAIVGVQISTAQLYISMENIGEGMFDRAYYAAPYYPMADRTLHIGLKWRFFN